MKSGSPDNRQEEVLGILLIALGVLVFISLVSYSPEEVPRYVGPGSASNSMGIVGAYVAHYLIQYTIGYSIFVLPLLLVFWGWSQFFQFETRSMVRWSIYVCVLALLTSIILAMYPVAFDRGEFPELSMYGIVGLHLAELLFDYFNTAGSIIILVALLLVTVVSATNVSFAVMFRTMSERLRPTFRALPAGVSSAMSRLRETVDLLRRDPPPGVRDKKPAPLPEIRERPEVDVPPPPTPPSFHEQLDLSPLDEQDHLEEGIAHDDEELVFGGPDEGARVPDMAAYQPPGMELLALPDSEETGVSKEELYANADVLEARLAEFGVQAKVKEIGPGPVITRYEVEPAPGVKVSRFLNLSDDLALGMRAKSIRIVAPVPGKGTIGVEIPNRTPKMVYLRSIIDSPEFREAKSDLALGLGSTIAGDVFVDDLARMPHLLIAGSTGSGKSVCINAIITSILFKAHPSRVQFVLIDPKRLELAIYKVLKRHHLSYRPDLNEEVATTPQNAIALLKSAEYEMERRYEKLAQAGVRNIDDYNFKLANQSGGADEEPERSLEYLVVIIDELADLMLTAAKEVEEPIARLTQMSRAVGIHLIVATQRPSVDVITGVIKANFPARIAFQVASKTDSRTILDVNGAERLLGRGDMLYMPPASPEPIRLHCAFVSVKEVEDIVDHIRHQPAYPKDKLPVRPEESSQADGFRSGGARDELFDEALKLVVRHQQGSISLLQRRLKVGYARAARLIDELEAASIVGAFDGSKARDVLVTEEQLEEMNL